MGSQISSYSPLKKFFHLPIVLKICLYCGNTSSIPVSASQICSPVTENEQHPKGYYDEVISKSQIVER